MIKNGQFAGKSYHVCIEPADAHEALSIDPRTKLGNIRHFKFQKLKKIVEGTFNEASTFHPLFNEKGGNLKEILFFTNLNGCVYHVGRSLKK